MIYNFLKGLSAETEKWNRGICFARSYFVPFSSKDICAASSPLKEITASDRAFSLSGQWDFFLDVSGASSVDTDSASWQKTDVPSFWKTEVCPSDPYLIGKKPRKPLPKGVYRTFFRVYNPNFSYFLNFTRVCGAFEIYVNGAFCGYSMTGEGEFDLSALVKEGENELVVVVHAFSTSDVFFASTVRQFGIGGDVVLSAHPEVFLVDYAFDSSFDSVAYVGKLSLAFLGNAEFRCKVSLVDGDKVLDVFEPSGKEQVVEFRGQFEPYAPGSPRLYDVFVQVFIDGKEVECTRLRVGFFDRKTDGKFLYCNHPVKIAATVYDGFFSDEGKLLSFEEREKEFSLLEKSHLNAVLTTVPAEPEFIRHCTERGILVIESFGFDLSALPAKGKKERDKFFSDIAAEDFVKEVCISRAMRDRSAPSVVGFSFGDCRDERCFKNVVDLLTLSSRFTLFAAPRNGCVTLVRPSSKEEAVALSHSFDQGVFFVLPGEMSKEDVEFYFNLVENAPGVFGCVVGRFRDLTLSGQLLAGGGLFASDLTPKDGAVLCKYFLRPLRSSLRERCFLDIRNVSFFVRKKSRVTIKKLRSGGEGGEKIRSFIAEIPPRETYTFDLQLGDIGFERKLEVCYRDEDGRHIASEIIHLNEKEPEVIGIEGLTGKTHDFDLHEFDKVDEENALPPRSRFVTYSTMKVADGDAEFLPKGSDSDRTMNLSGTWQFRYFGEKIPNKLSTEGEWDAVVVPGSWEENGYEKQSFVKGYAFPIKKSKKVFEFDKKAGNTAGAYRKILSVSDLSYRYYLYFENVSGAAQVYLNGAYVGCSSYRSAEFDISDYLSIGENELVVVVHKWSKNSFIYAENNFAATGILGDVLLTKRPAHGMFDCIIEEGYFGNAPTFRLTSSFTKIGGEARMTVAKNGNVLWVENKEISEKVLTFETDCLIKPYSPEKPEVYDVYLSVYEDGKEAECSKIKTSFCAVTRENGVTYLNGAPLKIRGVVYNPVYDRDGRMLTLADNKADLDLIVRYGFNAVRPSFPPSEAFLLACQEKGLLVMPLVPVAEAALSDPKRKEGVWFKKEFIERVKKQAEREYRRTKLVGNVIGLIFTQDVSYPAIGASVELLKKLGAKNVFAGGKAGDVVGLSYPSIRTLTDSIDGAMGSTSLLFTEYAPSYGIGCADTERYEDIIAESSCCLGGFIKQFTDDVIGDVCGSDSGLFTERRQPTVGADNVKFLYRKVTARLISDSQIEIENRREFADTSDMKIVVCIVRDGHTLSRTELAATVPPKASRVFDVFIDHAEGDMFVNVEFRNKEKDIVLYTEQYRLSEKLLGVMPKEEGTLRVDELPDYLDITYHGGKMRFDKKLGAFVRYTVMGKEVLKPERLERGGNCFIGNIDRPFVRNMRKKDRPQWTKSQRDFSWTKSADNSYVDILVETSLNLKGKESFVIRDKYIVRAGGEIEVFSVINPMRRRLPNLDCFGKQLRLHNAFGNVDYYGLGENSSYVDMLGSGRMGVFSLSVDKVFDGVNLKQECGNRMNVHYVAVRDKDGDGILCVAEGTPFQMRVSPLSDKEIERAFSGEKIEQSGVYLDVNAFVSGYGSNGAEPAKKYTYLPVEYVLHFSLFPVCNLKDR